MMSRHLNLLPRGLRPEAARFPWGWLNRLLQQSSAIRYGLLLLCFALILGGWQATWIWRYHSNSRHLRNELEKIRVLSTQLKTEQQALNVKRATLTAKLEQLQARRQALVGVTESSVPPSTILTELVGILPEQVWITTLSFSGDVLKIAGVSRETQAVADFMAGLESSRGFRETTFGHTERSTQTPEAGFAFEISTKPVQMDANPP